MKFFMLLLLASFSLSSHAKSVEIFSMNLHCALGNWKKRLDVILDEVIRRQPDVIGFQEVCKNDHIDMTDYILSELRIKGYLFSSWETVETHRSFISYQEELLIISKDPANEVLEGELPGLKFFENNYVGLKVNGVWFVTTHLHFALPSIRKAQYQKLNHELVSKDVVIFGDMNSHPGNKETEVFHKHNWIPYFNGPTYPAGNANKVFDGFWASQSLGLQLEKGEVEVLFKGLEEAPSDHLGVYFRAEYK